MPTPARVTSTTPPDGAGGTADHDRPRETETQRADRNFGDLLQELRVAQTGVQILFAFLLTMPVAARWEALGSYERGVWAVAVVLSALASTVLIAPVAYHRVLFRQRMKDRIVNAAQRFAVAGLGLLGLAVVTSVHLVLHIVLGTTAAVVIAGGLLAVVVLTWGVLPLLQRRRTVT